MGASLEKAVSKAATESGLLGIESAEINLDSDINLNLDSSAIGIVVAVLVGLMVVIVIVITLCSRYCCNCCDNLCFQGRGQNLHKKKQQIMIRDGQFGSDYHSNLNPAMSIMPPDYDHGHGCPSCGSQMGGFATSMKRAPSMAASLFARETVSRREEKHNRAGADGFVIPVNHASDYHTLSHVEKNHLMKSHPTIQYCTMANGEVGMYIPKANLMDVLDHSHVKTGPMISPSMKCYMSDNRSSTLQPKAIDWELSYTTETETETRRPHDRKPHDRRRRRRRSKTSRSHRSSGYKSDSSQSRPKSNRTITMSSLSDAEGEQQYHRRQMTIIEETKRRRGGGKSAKLSNVEEQLFNTTGQMPSLSHLPSKHS